MACLWRITGTNSNLFPSLDLGHLLGLSMQQLFVMLSIHAHHIVALASLFELWSLSFCTFWNCFLFIHRCARFLKILYARLSNGHLQHPATIFELAVAVPVVSFGVDAEQSLSASMGSSIEVLVVLLLLLVYVVLAQKCTWFG